MLLAPPKPNGQVSLRHKVYCKLAIDPSNSSIHCCEAGLSCHSTDKRIGRQCKGISVQASWLPWVCLWFPWCMDLSALLVGIAWLVSPCNGDFGMTEILRWRIQQSSMVPWRFCAPLSIWYWQEQALVQTTCNGGKCSKSASLFCLMQQDFDRFYKSSPWDHGSNIAGL